MAGGHLISEEEYVQDITQVTEPKQLSPDSPCGAVLPSTKPAEEVAVDNQE